MGYMDIFERLRKAGMSATGALGAMGNMREESNLEACRVQGDFQNDRWPSKDYASRVDNGLLDTESFARDGKGWGLVQYTWSGYKRQLLQLCKQRGVSIADEDAQVDYLVSTLKAEFPSLWSFLCNCGEDQLYEATSRFCREFERPAYNNVDVRFKAAQEVRDLIQGQAVENIDNSVSEPKQELFWPPRMLCQDMNGADVQLLQAALMCHGYHCGGTSGIFDVRTRNMVLAFQTEHGLDVDGIAGPKTFKALGVTW